MLSLGTKYKLRGSCGLSGVQECLVKGQPPLSSTSHIPRVSPRQADVLHGDRVGKRNEVGHDKLNPSASPISITKASFGSHFLAIS